MRQEKGAAAHLQGSVEVDKSTTELDEYLGDNASTESSQRVVESESQRLCENASLHQPGARSQRHTYTNFFSALIHRIRNQRVNPERCKQQREPRKSRQPPSATENALWRFPTTRPAKASIRKQCSARYACNGIPDAKPPPYLWWMGYRAERIKTDLLLGP